MAEYSGILVLHVYTDSIKLTSSTNDIYDIQAERKEAINDSNTHTTFYCFIFSFKFRTFGKKSLSLKASRTANTLNFELVNPKSLDKYYSDYFNLNFHLAINIKGANNNVHLFNYHQSLISYFVTKRYTNDDKNLENLFFSILLYYQLFYTTYKIEFDKDKQLQNYILSYYRKICPPNSLIILIILEILGNNYILIDKTNFDQYFRRYYFNGTLRKELLNDKIITNDNYHAYEYYEDCFNKICLNYLIHNEPEKITINDIGDERKGKFIFELISKEGNNKINLPIFQKYKKILNPVYEPQCLIMQGKPANVNVMFNKLGQEIMQEANKNITQANEMDRINKQKIEEIESESAIIRTLESDLQNIQNENAPNKEKLQSISNQITNLNRRIKSCYEATY